MDLGGINCWEKTAQTLHTEKKIFRKVEETYSYTLIFCNFTFSFSKPIFSPLIFIIFLKRFFLGFYRYRYNTGIYTGTGPVFWVPVFFVKYRNYRYFPVFFLFSRSHFFKWEMHQVVRNAPSDKRTEALLQVRPTSVDSERCFLLCNRIISPTRTQLSDYKFYTLIFIYENRNFY